MGYPMHKFVPNLFYVKEIWHMGEIPDQELRTWTIYNSN
jgi:hypothetical protein